MRELLVKYVFILKAYVGLIFVCDSMSTHPEKYELE